MQGQDYPTPFYFLRFNMIIETKDLYAVQIAVLHPDGDALAGSCIPTDRRKTTYFPNVGGEWKYTLGGKIDIVNGLIETPITAAKRELYEEGYILPDGASLYEVFRAVKHFVPYEERRFFFYSVVVCDTPLILNQGDYLEKPNGIKPTKMSVKEISQMWDSGDSTEVYLNIYQRVLNGEKNIQPLNCKRGIWSW